MQTPLAPKGEGADQKAKHGAMTPGPYLNGSTHWWAWAIHVGLLDRWTTALLESDRKRNNDEMQYDYSVITTSTFYKLFVFVTFNQPWDGNISKTA